MNPWDKIFKENFELALSQAEDQYSEVASDLNLRARANCNLLLNNYQSALNDYSDLFTRNSDTNQLGDVLCLKIGLCYYALKDYELAKKYFAYPLTNKTKVIYTSGIFRPPSFLLLISKIFKDSKLEKITMKELNKSHLTVPKYLTDRITESELKEELEHIENETLRNRSECVFEFYKAVKYFGNGTNSKYISHLEECERIKGKYLEFEYYFAKVELDKLKEKST
ncbi:hypothetical protein JoomaDRAFT_0874 [Galbibacter orientalis DSM 19592]|uniref:Tetratricopeptide repeat protein n=1 Tax=Galbibacter orientalis DSM 19592 TaxID=926559 RepID=I3C2Q9_9FLAO|nr:hypothetical protein [Galbibacter orientalis]EIJ37902.1 hypothetical protein JoomaDRAFT_0874 [Galbibacter orientalis DSM 19592]